MEALLALFSCFSSNSALQASFPGSRISQDIAKQTKLGLITRFVKCQLAVSG